MKEYSDNIIKKLADMIKISSSIKKLYNKLIELELNGKKGSEEYQKILEYLDLNLEYENKLYQNGLEPADYDLIIDHILVDKLSEKVLNNNEAIVKQDYTELTLRRILNFLFKKSESLSTNKEKGYKSFIDLLSDHDFDVKLFKKCFDDTIITKEKIKNNVILSFLAFIEELLNKAELSDIKEFLIKAKYNMIFINKEVENEFLNNNGDATLDNKATMYLRLSLIRAYFLMLEDDTLREVDSIYHEFLIGYDIITCTKYNRKGKKLIDASFENIENDREKFKIKKIGKGNGIS